MLEPSAMPYHLFSDRRFLAMAMILLANVANSKDIVCYFAADEGAICKCIEGCSKKWSNGSASPAPKPQNVTLGWSVYNKDKMKYIGGKITLTQRASHFKDGLEGYDIEVTGRRRAPKRYCCTVMDFETDTRYVTFHFNPPFPEVNPGTTLTYVIIPLPMYRKNDIPSWVQKRMSIPGCGDPALKEVDECIKKSDNAITTMNTNYSPKETTVSDVIAPGRGLELIHIVLIVMLAFVLPIAVIIGVITGKKKWENIRNKSRTRRKILVLSDVVDQNSMKIANELVEILKKCGGAGVQVTANIRNNLEIGDLGIVRWIKKTVEEMDIVLLLLGHCPDTQGESDILSLIAASTSLEAAIATGRRELIVVNTNGSYENDGSFHESYNLVCNLLKIMQRTLGPHFQPDIFHKNRHYAIELFSGASGKTLKNANSPSANCQAGTSRNNLGGSLSYEDEQIPLITWNIAGEELPSMESNV